MDTATKELFQYGIIGVFAALIIYASAAGRIHWGSAIDYERKQHEQIINDIRKQRDEAIAGWRSQSAATEKLSAVLEEKNRVDLERLREMREEHR